MKLSACLAAAIDCGGLFSNNPRSSLRGTMTMTMITPAAIVSTHNRASGYSLANVCIPFDMEPDAKLVAGTAKRHDVVAVAGADARKDDQRRQAIGDVLLDLVLERREVLHLSHGRRREAESRSDGARDRVRRVDHGARAAKRQVAQLAELEELGLQCRSARCSGRMAGEFSAHTRTQRARHRAYQ